MAFGRHDLGSATG